MMPKRIEVLGVPVDCVDMAEALKAVDTMIAERRKAAVIAVNPEKVIAAKRNPQLMDAIRSAGLLIPDGIGVVLAARLLGLARMQRVPGSELMPALCKAAEQKGYRVYFFGAAPEVNAAAVGAMRKRHPGLNIVGNCHGYVKDDDLEKMIDSINALAVDVMFVALGSPKQELWMNEYLARLDVKVCQGVGGTFDVIVGNVKRAPAAFRRLHLEWFYRLVRQPKRILRQTALPRFAAGVLWQGTLGRVLR
jgi:N-acetylglucosaminyldiphosphoundecaprenol N-acetyl-beta-D-mannosaminyltransferase